MLKNTIDLHRQGQLDAAEAGYNDYLAQHPNDAEALRLLGALRFQKGDRDAALALLDHAHRAAPEQPAPLLTLGKLHLDSRELDAARDAYTRALTLDPNNANAHAVLGQIAMMQGNARLAEQHFRTSLRAGDDGHAMAGLAMLACDAGDAAAALRHATEAVRLLPNDVLAYFTLGRAFLLNGNLAFAEQAFNNALSLRPDFAPVLHAMGLLLLEDGRPAEAEQRFLRLAEAPGFELGSNIGLGDALRAQRRFGEAIEHYRTALVMAPGLDKVAEAQLFCLAQVGDFAEALLLLEHLIGLGGATEAKWRNQRVVLTTRLDRYDLAIVDNEWLLANDPGQLQYHENLGFLHENLGNFAAAEPHVTTVLAQQPGNAEMSLVRIREAFRHGDFDSAADRIEGLRKQPVSEGQARLCENYLGRIADHAGEHDKAVAHLAAAQRGLPSLRQEVGVIPESLAGWLDVPAIAGWEHAPILLLGTPGSGVERIAQLLADQPQLWVPRDRSGERDRRDLFGMPPLDRFDSELSVDEIEQARAVYVAAAQAFGAVDGRIAVDWLTRWDARLLALVHRIMPGTRIIVVDRDPRASLLDWLAFGWLPTVPVDDLDSASDWLARARAHIRHGIGLGGPEHLVVDAAAVGADPDGAEGRALAAFVGIDRLVPGREFERGRLGTGGMPMRFDDTDHWQRYRSALAGPFARLAD